MDIIETFAYLTHPDGTRFQVIVRDEDGAPIASDIDAAKALYDAHEAQKNE